MHPHTRSNRSAAQARARTSATAHARLRPHHHSPLQTCNAWLAKLDANQAAALRCLSDIYGAKDGLKWYVNWRLFFISCAELFDFARGNEWAVSHYLFEKPVRGAASATASAAATR